MKADAEKLETKASRHQFSFKNHYSELLINEIFKEPPFLNSEYISSQFAIFKKIIVKKNEDDLPPGGFRGNLMSHINRNS